MPKKIVVCCDGTGNEFGDRNSNVIKLHKMLVFDARQIVYYHPGVGTMGSRNALSAVGKLWTKVIGLAFGYGISDNIADAYQFLMRNFQPDDEVYVFGFSRGAYTARALCGMLHMVGLLHQGNEGQIPYALRLVKRRKFTIKDFDVARDFKRTFSRECKPHFIGVWDTVSSLGWVYNPVRFPYTNAAKNLDFHVMRHAMSIDERRAFFRQNSFGDTCPTAHPPQDLIEAWFAGVHSDVGGSYKELESQLSKVTLKWMLAEAEHFGLLVDQDWKFDILGGTPPRHHPSYHGQPHWVAPDPTTKYQHEQLHGFWWIAELWPKLVKAKSASGKWHDWVRINLGRRRTIPADALFHESVVQRLAATNIHYRPSNVPENIPPAQIVYDRRPATTRAATP